jgi:uncharacterized membrane protein
LFVVSYSGRETADRAYDAIRDLEKDKKVDIKTAMTVSRKDNGKLKLKHRRRLTAGKGLLAGGAVGLLIGGAVAPAVLGGAAVGALIGSSRHGNRKELKGFLEDKLGPEDSALAVLIKEADWTAVNETMDPFEGETLLVELTDDDAEALEAWATSDEAAAAVEEEAEVVEEDDVEVVE